MSIQANYLDQGFAPWSLMGPTNQSKVSGANEKYISQPNTTTGQATGDPVSQRFEDHLSPASNKTDTQVPANASQQEKLGLVDLLDVINPLQHIPGVASIYREVTGDEISAPARVAGGTLYGAIPGFFVSAFNAILEQESGNDLGGHMIAAVKNDPSASAAALNEVSPASGSAPMSSEAPSLVFPTDNRVQAAEVLDSRSPSETKNPISDPSIDNSAPNLAQTQTASVENTVRAGGIDMTLMPGAIPIEKTPHVYSAKPEKVAKDIPAPSQMAQDAALSAQPIAEKPAFKPLSKDVQMQLERIRTIQSNNALLDAQSEARIEPQAAPKVAPTVQRKVPTNLIGAMAENSGGGLNFPTTSPVDISESMMKALEKYEAMVNGG